MMRRPARFAAGVAAGLVLLAFVYAPALRGGLIWNDADYITKPELQSWAGLGRIWGDLGATEQYYPLLHSAFWLEHRLWGDSPEGYHWINLLLHATSALLFVLLLRRLKVPGAEWAGFLFALHPVAVESVAWISEQKNTLSTVFYLASACAYFARRESRPLAAPWGLALFWFVAALLSKSATATLPAALLVVIWWRQGSLSWKRDIAPLTPWLVLGAGWGLFSAWVERTYIGAAGSAFALSLPLRFILAGRAAWFYAAKLLWPRRLIFIYPHWDLSLHSWQWLYPVTAIAALAALAVRARSSRGPLATALLFGGALFPTLGFFNVYAFVYSYVADHWAYLASLAMIAGVAGGAASIFRGASRRWRPALGCIFILATAILAVQSRLQAGLYRDMDTFYRLTLDRNPDSWMGHVNLGLLLLERGNRGEAEGHFRTAVRLKPDNPQAHNDLGLALFRSGRVAEAIEEYAAAIRLVPVFAEAQNNLGFALSSLGRQEEAFSHLQEAIRLRPGYAEAHNNLGIVYAKSERPEEAWTEFHRATLLNPTYVNAWVNLGNAALMRRRPSDAVAAFEEALRLDPASPAAQAGLDYARQQSAAQP